MNRSDAKTTFALLFDEVNGFDISAKSRRKHEMTDKELTYGEVVFDSFWDILDVIQPHKNDVFYDLGCGTGKPVFIAALYSGYRKAIGVELLPEVFEEAVRIMKHCQKMLPELKTELSFLHEDIFNIDFSDADTVFLPSTCFDKTHMEMMSERCLKLKPGSSIITLTKQLEGSEFSLKHRRLYEMTWGKTTVHIFERK